MTAHQRNGFLLFCSIALGLGVSTGRPLGMMAAVGMPLVSLAPDARKCALRNAFGYYASALWPMIAGVGAYWKSDIVLPPLLWICTALLLSVPWTIAWTADSVHFSWRAPAALLATVVPPLGIIGLASPLTGAGYLLPGTGWVGLTFVGFVPGIVLSCKAMERQHRSVVLAISIALCATLAILGRWAHPQDSRCPAGWRAVNTHFGDISLPFKDFAAAQFIQQETARSRSHVVIFPESVVPRWSEATEAFWRQSLDQCRRRGQTLVIGAGLPSNTEGRWDRVQRRNYLKSYDFEAAIGALKNMNLQPGRHEQIQSGQIKPAVAPPGDNTLLVVGAESAALYQRVPVPLAMWRPFSRDSVPLRLDAPGVLKIDHQRVAVLICYEQMLGYPILASMLQHPTVIVGISNTFWISGTTIPRYQANALQSWARLFALPYLSAVNS